MPEYQPTKKELEVLNILWNSSTPLTAKQIVETNPALNMSTVQSVLKKLLANELIGTAEIVYSGTVLTRSYSPLVDEESFVVQQYDNLDISKLVNSFLGHRTKEEAQKDIDEIEQLLSQKRKELK